MIGLDVFKDVGFDLGKATALQTQPLAVGSFCHFGPDEAVQICKHMATGINER